ncbi:amino acid ABC transporter permease [Aureimonas jatrophae]|jgi:polar amino acid transport system permease protein|uniref:Amino acid ABC transporter membrane protein, PAAT family n=1 Tax=Aureimonas jatrophae TaxID=1166073 RepID=A0A1H0LAC4_9HYPH|nr:amino acid ABC transporter permease [Aureimonas jatrophae]MBB3952479.1 polar amino acid transport system permease protein [Aureimonas jatrophae]SDO65194.1 amino acid ABC transporter membrane protein, PAAT family [Aureimonas jatrophae]
MDIVSTFFNVDVLWNAFPLLLSGLGRTVLLGFLSIALGLVGGLGLALARLYGAKPVRWLAIAYIDVFRALPVLVWLVVVYYALPFVGIRFSPFFAATFALATVSSAYAAEIFRAGIEAIPRGQFEAADALGLHAWAKMRRVILPQAIRIVIPPLTNNSINVLKDTALASVVALPDLLKQATQAQALAANPSPLIGAAILYLLILLPLVRLVSRFEQHSARQQAR